MTLEQDQQAKCPASTGRKAGGDTLNDLAAIQLARHQRAEAARSKVPKGNRAVVQVAMFGRGRAKNVLQVHTAEATEKVTPEQRPRRAHFVRLSLLYCRFWTSMTLYWNVLSNFAAALRHLLDILRGIGNILPARTWPGILLRRGVGWAESR